jgi:hypothetical protein
MVPKGGLDNRDGKFFKLQAYELLCHLTCSSRCGSDLEGFQTDRLGYSLDFFERKHRTLFLDEGSIEKNVMVGQKSKHSRVEEGRGGCRLPVVLSVPFETPPHSGLP